MRYRTSTTGINAIEGIAGVTIFPNPASTHLTLTLSFGEGTSVEIYNTIGECVHRQIVSSSNCQIDVSNLAEGVYNILIQNAEFTINKKVVIVR